MTMIGTNGSKTWRLGSGGGRRSEAEPIRAKDGVKDGVKDNARDEVRLEGKLLAKSKASLAESERMLSRQTTLLAELRADGLVTTEVEKSVARLEAALLAQRSAHDGLLAKSSASTDATSGAA